MRKLLGRNRVTGFILFALALGLSAAISLGTPEAIIVGEPGPPEGVGMAVGPDDARVREVMDVQNRHTQALMSLPDVVGTATGLADDGTPAVLVFTRRAIEPGTVPVHLEGKRVVVRVTGDFFAAAKPAPGGTLSPTDKWTLPVPIGVSTGNENECSAGTIGTRVKKADGSIYALSNNHVFALENSASLGDDILQPGKYDVTRTGTCTDFGPSKVNYIGTLADFEPISFSVSNTIDAALALTNVASLGNSTPPNGYGTPASTTVSAAVNMAVQKYGRTTSLTRGTITGINASVTVGYSGGNATFVNQIIVTSRRAFLKSGDSGSLLVTDPGAWPVGLLFASNNTGTYAIANRIQDVLTRFGVTIDGK